MRQQNSHLTHFLEISYLGLWLKFVDASQFWLKFSKVTDSVLCEVQAEAREIGGVLNILKLV